MNDCAGEALENFRMADSEPQKSAEATRIPALEDTPIAYRLVISGGAASFMLGLSVLIGWHAHLPTLIQVSPDFVPMQYNTALGFLLSGLGLRCLTGNRAGVGGACGILVMLVGTATLAESDGALHHGQNATCWPHGAKLVSTLAVRVHSRSA